MRRLLRRTWRALRAAYVAIGYPRGRGAVMSLLWFGVLLWQAIARHYRGLGVTIIAGSIWLAADWLNDQAKERHRRLERTYVELVRAWADALKRDPR